MRIGMDVGSTTLKCVAIDNNNNIVYKAYERHYSKIAEKTGQSFKSVDCALQRVRKKLKSIMS